MLSFLLERRGIQKLLLLNSLKTGHVYITYRVRLLLATSLFVQCLVHILHVLAAGRTCKTRYL